MQRRSSHANMNYEFAFSILPMASTRIDNAPFNRLTDRSRPYRKPM